MLLYKQRYVAGGTPSIARAARRRLRPRRPPHMLTERCVELVGATEAGLLPADGSGELRVMAASRERTHVFELFQI